MHFRDAEEPVAEPDWAAFIAVDWADQKHDWAMEVPGGNIRERGQVAHAPEALDAWVTQLRQRFGDRPIAVALEQSRGALLFTLSKYANLVLYPLHPRTTSCFREAMYPSGSKSDPLDADIQLDLLVKHRDRLQVWKPDTEETRLLQFLVEDRRRRVDQKTGLLNQLTGRLKLYFPQILRWFPSADSALAWRFLERWPDLQSAQKVSRQKLKAFLTRDARSCPADVDQFINRIREAMPATQDRAVVSSSTVFVQGLVCELQLLRATIQKYEKQIEAIVQQHPDFPIVSSFPGIGKALAPRLIAALGTQRERFPDAGSIQSYSGIAPVREASGKREWVHVRWACPKFVKQTFQEWAQHSMTRCAWARRHYDAQRARGKGHQTAVRSLAFKWIRVLFRCWKDRTPYDENRYTKSLGRRSATPNTDVRIMWKNVGGFSKPAAFSD
jgi:Transposase IS116/IS110/IS902 family./Transposase.